MRFKNPLTIITVILSLHGCDDRAENNPEPEPVYSEMNVVTEVTSTSATFQLRVKFPISETSAGDYRLDEKYFTSYGFLYTTNPDQASRFWKLVEHDVENSSGAYQLEVSDLAPATKYYVKSWVVTVKEKQQFGFVNTSENTLEFQTAQ